MPHFGIIVFLMPREFFDPRTHAFLRDEGLRSAYSGELLNTLENFYNTLFREAPAVISKWHRENHGIIMPFGSVLFGTAMRNVSDIDEFGIYDGELSQGEQNAVGNALIGNILLGEETRAQGASLDTTFSSISSLSSRSPITVALLSQERVRATIVDSLYADPYFQSLPIDDDNLQTIAMVTLFIIPDNLVFPTGEFSLVTNQNLQHHRLQVARSLLRASENQPRFNDLQSELTRAYHHSYDRSLKKHPNEWMELAEQIFTLRGSRNSQRAAKLLVHVRQRPGFFPSPAEIFRWLRANS